MSNEELNRRLSMFDAVEPSGPASEAQIAAAEDQLGIRFPPQYREFLSNFGSGGVDSEDFIGLNRPEHLNIVKLTSRLRARNNPLPARLLPLRGDGFGNYDCLVQRPTTHGEFAIVQWNHELVKSKNVSCLPIRSTLGLN